MLAAAEPEAVEEVEDEVRVAAADTDAAPIVPEPIEAVTADSNELVAVAEDNAIDNSVLPALAEAAGQSVTAVPATVQAVTPPTSKDGTKKDGKGTSFRQAFLPMLPMPSDWLLMSCWQLRLKKYILNR